MLLPFESDSETLTVTDLGSGQVRVEFGTVNWVMNIVENSLVPAGPINPDIAYFSMVTDGSGISITSIDTAAGVSARIGLAARLP